MLFIQNLNKKGYTGYKFNNNYDLIVEDLIHKHNQDELFKIIENEVDPNTILWKGVVYDKDDFFKIAQEKEEGEIILIENNEIYTSELYGVFYHYGKTGGEWNFWKTPFKKHIIENIILDFDEQWDFFNIPAYQVLNNGEIVEKVEQKEFVSPEDVPYELKLFNYYDSKDIYFNTKRKDISIDYYYRTTEFDFLFFTTKEYNGNLTNFGVKEYDEKDHYFWNHVIGYFAVPKNILSKEQQFEITNQVASNVSFLYGDNNDVLQNKIKSFLKNELSNSWEKNHSFFETEYYIPLKENIQDHEPLERLNDLWNKKQTKKKLDKKTIDEANLLISNIVENNDLTRLSCFEWVNYELYQSSKENLKYWYEEYVDLIVNQEIKIALEKPEFVKTENEVLK